MVWILSSKTVKTPELDASFDEADVMSSSVSPDFPHSVSTISDTSRQQLALSIKSCESWCQSRALLLSLSYVGKMLVSK